MNRADGILNAGPLVVSCQRVSWECLEDRSLVLFQIPKEPKVKNLPSLRLKYSSKNHSNSKETAKKKLSYSTSDQEEDQEPVTKTISLESLVFNAYQRNFKDHSKGSNKMINGFRSAYQ